MDDRAINIRGVVSDVLYCLYHIMQFFSLDQKHLAVKFVWNLLNSNKKLYQLEVAFPQLLEGVLISYETLANR